MHLELTGEEITELRSALDMVVSDLSPEIADTDNADYRAMLRQRRECLRSVRDRLDSSTTAPLIGTP